MILLKRNCLVQIFLNVIFVKLLVLQICIFMRLVSESEVSVKNMIKNEIRLGLINIMMFN